MRLSLNLVKELNLKLTKADLPTALGKKADKQSLTTLQTAVSGKADKKDLENKAGDISSSFRTRRCHIPALKGMVLQRH